MWDVCVCSVEELQIGTPTDGASVAHVFGQRTLLDKYHRLTLCFHSTHACVFHVVHPYEEQPSQ